MSLAGCDAATLAVDEDGGSAPTSIDASSDDASIDAPAWDSGAALDAPEASRDVWSPGDAFVSGADDASPATDAGSLELRDAPDAWRAPLEPCRAEAPRRAGSMGRHTGIDEVVPGHLYAVYSVNHRPPSPMPAGVVDIFVARLRGRAVLIFGAGFGDPGGDHEEYNAAMDQVDAPLRSAAHDASEVAHAVASCMGLDPTAGAVGVTFLVPHAHLDHVNQEFFDALATHDLAPSEVIVHTRDRAQATCGAACCGRGALGGPACDAVADPDFGAPYDPPWTSTWLTRFRSVGAMGDVRCSTVVQSFETEALGTLEVLYNGLHTPGTVDVRTAAGAPTPFVLGGAFTTSVCPLPPGSSGGFRVGAHDNVVL